MRWFFLSLRTCREVCYAYFSSLFENSMAVCIIQLRLLCELCRRCTVLELAIVCVSLGLSLLCGLMAWRTAAASASKQFPGPRLSR
jgi:hypothetical protein